jgi:hypothetical protein
VSGNPIGLVDDRDPRVWVACEQLSRDGEAKDPCADYDAVIGGGHLSERSRDVCGRLYPPLTNGLRRDCFQLGIGWGVVGDPDCSQIPSRRSQ